MKAAARQVGIATRLVRAGPRGPARVGGLLVLAMLVLALLAESAACAETADQSGWQRRPQLTGDWGGWRSRMAERGVLLGASYSAGFWSNVDGGFQIGTRYDGFASWFIDLELEPLVGWKGGGFEINWYSYHGGLPTEELVGGFPTQTVSGYETVVSVRFYEIYLRQSFWDDRLYVKLGQLAADVDFFVSEHAATLLNGTFGLLSAGRETGLTPFYPLAAPGVYLGARTADRAWELRFGAYTADSGRDTRDNFGFGWGFGSGATFLAEIRGRRSPFGLPASYAVGFGGTTASITNLTTGATEKGGYFIYATIDQAVVRGRASRPALGVFLRGIGGPDGEKTPFDWYVDFGLQLTRPFGGRFRSRTEDVFSLGFAYMSFSEGYLAQMLARGELVTSRQSVLELTYRFQLAGWLTLQPDLQLYFDPHFSRRNATVIGLRAAIEL